MINIEWEINIEYMGKKWYHEGLRTDTSQKIPSFLPKKTITISPKPSKKK